MLIGGLQKTTLIDYPGKVACTVFLVGCNFRCPWCQNKTLVLPAEIKKQPKISENDFFRFLRGRRELLDGVCLSIAGDEPVAIIDKGVLKHVPIENLWDRSKTTNLRYHPIVHECQKVDFECLTKDGFQKAKEIIRHKTKELYKVIVSPGNYNVKLTGGHSIFVLTKKGIETKKAAELKKGEFLLGATSSLIGRPFQTKTLDLIKDAPELLDDGKWLVAKTYIRNKFSRTKIKIPRKIRIDKPFCEFLGYAVAEGSSRHRNKRTISPNGYQFSLGDEPELGGRILELYKDIFESESGTVQKKTVFNGNVQYNVVIGNLLVAKLIDSLVGKGFKNKHIPAVIFNTSSNNKITFLEALIKGDGHRRIRQQKSQQEVSIKTASKLLAGDIVFLVNTLGGFAWLEESKKRPGHHDSFRIVISSNSLAQLKLKKQIRTNYSFTTRIKGIPKVLIDYASRGQKRIDPRKICNWASLYNPLNLSAKEKAAAVRFGFLTNGGEISEKTKRIQFIFELMKKWDIKEVKSVKKNKLRLPKYVYDLVVPGNHSFVGGTGSLLLHNTGGEPTIQPGLPEFMGKIKKMGFLVKLDTNGSNPEMLEKLIKQKLIDYVAMDVKTSLKAKSVKRKAQNYEKATGVKADIEKIKRSIALIKNSGVEYEFRTTVVPGIHTKRGILQMARELAPARAYFLQNFRPEKTLNLKFSKIRPYPRRFLSGIKKEIASAFTICEIR